MSVSLIFKILYFTIALNFATGFIMQLVPEFNYHANIDTHSEMMGLSYNETYSDDFTTGMNDTINPQQTITDASSGFFQLLNKIGLGFIANIITVVDQYMYGFVNLIYSLFAGYLPSGLATMIHVALYGMMTFAYIMAAFSLWTGKEVN
jgi:ABC-type uncharacterized transport system fused permease/ATPase subunit